jgi:hypothetical protein
MFTYSDVKLLQIKEKFIEEESKLLLFTFTSDI